jgi:hypothetical protein
MSQQLENFYKIRKRLLQSNLKSIVLELMASGDGQSRSIALQLTLSLLAEHRPEEAWDILSSLEGQKQDVTISSMTYTLAQSDPERMLQKVGYMKSGPMRTQLFALALGKIAQTDPARALDISLQRESEFPDSLPHQQIFNQWATRDFASAKAALSRLSGPALENAAQGILASLAEKDPRMALREAEALAKLPGLANLNISRSGILSTLIAKDPATALTLLLESEKSPAREDNISTLFSQWGNQDHAAAITAALQLNDPEEIASAITAIASSHAGNGSIDRARLLDLLIERVPSGDRFRNATTQLFYAWAREDPQAAAAAISKIPPGQSYESAMRAISSEWSAKGGHAAVTAWLQSLPGSVGRSSALTATFTSWSAADPTASTSILSSLKPDDRRTAISGIAAGWGKNDPQAALRWSESLIDPAQQATAIRATLQAWADRSPEEAAGYAERLPTTISEEDRKAVMRSVVSEWASNNTEAAARWVENLPSGGEKDSALGALANRIEDEDPEAALAWAGLISDEKARTRNMENVARSWMRYDKASATEWVKESKLPEENKKRLLR